MRSAARLLTLGLVVGAGAAADGQARGAPPVVSNPSPSLSPSYRDLVLRYQSGDRDRAVLALAGLPDERVQAELPVLGSRVGPVSRLTLAVGMRAEAWAAIPVRAALMLHTDCALWARQQQRAPWLHESAAWSIAHMLKDLPTERAYVEAWYRVMAGAAFAEARWGDALDWAERGLVAFSASSDLLLVIAAFAETQADHPGIVPPPATDTFGDPATRARRQQMAVRAEARRSMERARETLVAALRADPASVEAHLRLGRVAARLGRADEARSELEAALASSRRPGEAFLAQLFLGALDEEAGQLPEAAVRYEAAVALQPQAQSGALALSHVRLRQGEPAAARAALERVLGAVGRQAPDPFRLYPWGPAADLEERLESLRRQAAAP